MITRRGALFGGLAGLAAALVRPRAARAGAAKNLVVWWNAGGWDTTFVLDPHFDDGSSIARDSESEKRSTGDIVWAHHENRPNVERFFERWGSRALVVNGIGVGSISHDGCTRLMLTGGRAETGADLPAIVAGKTGSELALPYAVISGPRMPGALGAYASDVNATFAEVVRAERDHETAIRSFLAEEADRALAAKDTPRLRSWRSGLDRLAAIRERAELFPTDPDAEIQSQIDLAVTLLGDGLTRSVMIKAPRPQGAQWDSHSDNAVMQPIAWDDSFENLLLLLDALDATDTDEGSLLDETVVLIASEMGRTPILNASEGKDHWPYTSAILVGGGVSGGRAIGATDEVLTGVPIDLSTGEAAEGGEKLTSARLLGGLLAGFDVDPEEYFPGVTGVGGIFSGE